jgi:hypothetical protein
MQFIDLGHIGITTTEDLIDTSSPKVVDHKKIEEQNIKAKELINKVKKIDLVKTILDK